jgi:alpha-1,2-mannosyltransferase
LFLPTTTERSIRLIILYSLVGAIIIAGFLLTARWLFVIDSSHADLVQDYRAAQMLLAGQPIYDAQLINNHPPFNAILFIPLTLLPYTQAFQLWGALSTILYLGIGYMVIRLLRIPLSPLGWLLGIGLALCWYPFQAHIALGQVSILLAACLIGGWALLRSGYGYAAGLLFALAFWIKLFPGLIFLFLLLRGKVKALIGAFVGLLLGGAFTLVWIGWEEAQHYFFHIAPSASQKYGPYPINISITSIPERYFTNGGWIEPLIALPHITFYLTAILAFIILAMLGRQLWLLPPGKQGDDIGFALTCLVMPLLSPISWQHGFVLLALPFGLLFAGAASVSDNKRRQLFLTLLAVFVFLSLPDIQLASWLMTVYAPYRMPWYAGMLFILPTLAIVLLWRALWRNRELFLFQAELLINRPSPL